MFTAIIITTIILTLFIFFQGRAASAALSSPHIFPDFEDSIHNNIEQQIRIERCCIEHISAL